MYFINISTQNYFIYGSIEHVKKNYKITISLLNNHIFLSLHSILQIYIYKTYYLNFANLI